MNIDIFFGISLIFSNYEVHNLNRRVLTTKKSSLMSKYRPYRGSSIRVTGDRMKMRLKTEKSEIMGNQNEKRYIPPEDNTTGGSSSSVSTNITVPKVEKSWKARV